MANDTIFKRKHKAVAERAHQLELNTLAAKGGRRYVDRRLWRAPNESDLSWFGTYGTAVTANANKTLDAGTVGRKERAALVNDAGRVVSKITQYLFKVDAQRPGVDEEWAGNVTGRGSSLLSFWVDASETLTAGQWLWLSVDRLAALKDENGNPRLRTLAEKARDRDVVKWTVWPANSVPDWNFSETGALLWLITQDTRYNNADPLTEAKEFIVRTLWRKTAAGVTFQEFRLMDGVVTALADETAVPGLSEIPFVLVGTPKAEPWWFDDVEALQAQLLNLDSLHAENLVRCVFPQLVIPETCVSSMELKLVERMGPNNGEAVMQVIRELVRGLDTPIMETSEDKGITRFIQPNASDLKAIPEEISRKRSLLFDMVGLSLFNRESRQIASAESKQFDQLDTESTLKHRARILEAAELRLVELSKLVDPLFKAYSPAWPSSFDVVDTAGDTQALTLLGNLPDMPPSMRRMVLVAALRILGEVSGQDKDLIQAARGEIEKMDFTEAIFSEKDQPPPGNGEAV